MRSLTTLALALMVFTATLTFAQEDDHSLATFEIFDSPKCTGVSLTNGSVPIFGTSCTCLPYPFEAFEPIGPQISIELIYDESDNERIACDLYQLTPGCGMGDPIQTVSNAKNRQTECTGISEVLQGSTGIAVQCYPASQSCH